MQNFWGWLFDKAELNDKMPLNLPNKFKDEYERFLGTKIIATNNERMGKKPMRVQGGRIKMRSPPKVLTGNFRPSQLSFFLS